MLLSRLDPLEKDCLYEYLLDYKLEYKESLDLKAETTFGVEIETYTDSLSGSLNHPFIKDMTKLSKDNNYSVWQLTKESKLGPNDEMGYELISPVLKDSKQVWEELNVACSFLKSKNLSINEKCGSHVHVGVPTFDKDFIINFFKLWSAFEDVLYRFSFGEYINPRSNMIKYSAPIRNQVLKIIKNIDESDTDLDVLNSLFLGKNKAINIQNIRDYLFLGEGKPTIEFRMANGTLNPIVWQNLIGGYSKMIEYVSNDFYEEFVDYVLEFEEVPNFGDSEFYSKVYFERGLLFSDIVFTKTEDKIRFLKQYVKDGNFTKEKKLVKTLSLTK